ncbi:stalk domain-containing protein [Brevibacillus sp. SAFN-007a]|uniref:stalk domain-containing protein n=1 Tax=Brevibacillus sp. SAFN-007a TaxID=3436862 RepID=UPI003F81E7D0
MKKWNYILAGVLGFTLIFGGTSVFAKSLMEKISARFANIKLIVNGQTISTKAEPFIYNGNVYAPVATVANMLGIKQEWDNKTPAVRFTDPNATLTSTTSASTDTPLGQGLHLIWNPGNTVVLEDRMHGIKLPIPAPAELEGKSSGVLSLTPALAELDYFSNDGKYEIYVFHYGNGSEVFLQLLQYETGKLTSLGEIKVGDAPNRVFGLYSGGQNTIYVQTFDTDGELNSTTLYNWDYENKKIKKGTGITAE